MPDKNLSIQLAHELKCCVIVPTFNNAPTLAAVIGDVMNFVEDVIIVNDGSTDDTEAVIQTLRVAGVISYEKNKGKGYALRQGFKKALEMGFCNAVTIDSDGQHTGHDIPGFLEKLNEFPGRLIIGSRLLRQENMPGGNTFANKFSNFWYRLQTSINLPDTQCGFRLYPLKQISEIHFFTNRFEAELEMLVRATWRGIPICSVPISVYYPPPEERISHFRPYRDFLRISVLNTFLTLWAVFYEYPKRWVLRLTRNS